MAISDPKSQDGDDGPGPAREDTAPAGRVASSISNSVVSVYADYTGRGPTRARTNFGRDVVTVVLEDTLTKAERRLVRCGEQDTVVDMRKTFQRAMKADLVAAVERHTGRQVVAFLSDHVTDPDVAVEVFVLHPEADKAA